MKRGGHDRLVMSGFALPVVLALPIVLAACPQFLSDWSIVGGSGPDATTDGGGGGPDATTDGGGGGPEASSEAEAGGAWTPLAIKSQLAFWLDPASLVVDGGTQIGRWQDLSGNGNDAIQGNPAYDPTYNASGINGLPSATFTGPITFLTILDSPTMQWSTDDFVVLAVVRATASATEAMLYQKTGPPPYNGASLYLNQDKPSASTLAAAQVSGSIYVTSVPPPATFVDGSVHLVGARRSGLTLEIRVDGAVSNSLNSAAVAATDVSVAGVNAYIGQNGLANVAAGTAELHQLHGDIAEMIGVHGTLSTTDLANAEQYLKTRYAIGGTVTPPSCAAGGPGMTTCPAGTGTGSCCTSLKVTGGSFDLTYTNTGSGPTGVSNPATVSSLRVDEYLVTVGRFRQFVNAALPADGGTGWTPPAGSGIHTHLNSGMGLLNSATGTTYENTAGGWNTAWNSNIAPTSGNLSGGTWTSSPGSNVAESLPITEVNWWEAYAFCIWDGGFLPSEAEWEYVAAGGSNMYEWPWGNTGRANPTASYAVYNNDYVGGLIAPVGTATNGVGLPWGHYDMVGDALEWVLDWYAPYASSCDNCANLTNSSSSSRVPRGGCFSDPPLNLPPTYRYGSPPAHRYNGLGLRCARTP